MLAFIAIFCFPLMSYRISWEKCYMCFKFARWFSTKSASDSQFLFVINGCKRIGKDPFVIHFLIYLYWICNLWHIKFQPSMKRMAFRGTFEYFGISRFLYTFPIFFHSLSLAKGCPLHSGWISRLCYVNHFRDNEIAIDNALIYRSREWSNTIYPREFIPRAATICSLVLSAVCDLQKGSKGTKGRRTSASAKGREQIEISACGANRLVELFAEHSSFRQNVHTELEIIGMRAVQRADLE